MKSEHIQSTDGAERWIRQLVNQYGPIVGGRELRELLGYRTAPAMQRAVRKDLVGAPVFSMPGRRGVFAITADIAMWLLERRRSAMAMCSEDGRFTAETEAENPADMPCATIP